MTNRPLFAIVKNRQPLLLPPETSVRKAALAMCENAAGSVLVADEKNGLCGIFTGRDAIRLLAKGGDVGSLTLSKAMTRNPVSMAPHSRAIDALRAMSEGNFRHLPVIHDGRVCGCISRGDFKGMELEAFHWFQQGRAASSATNRVLGEIAGGQKLLTLETSATVHEACHAMRRAKRVATLVVDGKGRLKGIFTGRDALRALARFKSAGSTTLGKAMTPDPVTISPDRHAIDALRAMCDGGFRHLPIVDAAGAIVGLVSQADFTGVELDRLEEEEHLKECIW